MLRTSFLKTVISIYHVYTLALATHVSANDTTVRLYQLFYQVQSYLVSDYVIQVEERR